MNRSELDELKEKVPCAALLEQAGFVVDVKESTRRAVKWRRGAEIVIVTHEGQGWFDPLSEAKGDVFSLATYLNGGDFTDALATIASMVGYKARTPKWKIPLRPKRPETSIPDRWQSRRTPWRGSATWRYLSEERHLPPSILRVAIMQGHLREGPYGSMWAAHTDHAGVVTGWEERGPEWRGFATGGMKVLFRFGGPEASRLCVVEAAIDAMSLAAIEGLRDGTLYLSTGGGWSPTTDAALRRLAVRPDALIVAATDANAQGDVFADRLRTLADEVDCGWQRLRPSADDWNEALKERKREKEEGRGKRVTGVPHTRRPRQG